MKAFFIKIIGGLLNLSSYLSKTFAGNKALALFCTPRKGQPNETQLDFLESAFQETLNYQNQAISTYRWPGQGTTVLLAHGWESNAGRWKKLVLALKKQNYNIIALDAPAHGSSGSKVFNAPLYAEFIKVVAQKHQPSALIGHSVGGMASVMFQHKEQLKCIQKIVLLGAPSEFKGILNNYIGMLGFNKRIITQLNTTIQERFGKRPEAFSTAIFIQNITCKGLIIHDKYDPIIPYSDALLINNNFRNAKLITTEGLGHSLNNDKVATQVCNFIAS